jgi:hypothetical protein
MAGKYYEGVMARNKDFPAEQPRGIPLRERLMQEREGALKQVARIDRALALLENNKDTEELINLLGGIY